MTTMQRIVKPFAQNGHGSVERTISFAADGDAPFSELAAIAQDALNITPPLYFNSIFGPPQTWLPPYQRFSEFSLLNPWQPLRMLKFLQNTWLPSIPRQPPLFSPRQLATGSSRRELASNRFKDRPTLRPAGPFGPVTAPRTM